MTAPDALLREALALLHEVHGHIGPDDQHLPERDRHVQIWVHTSTVNTMGDRIRALDAATPPASAPDALAARAFETCPICQSWTVVRLAADWNDGRVLPVIACGNPWHYVFPATPPASAERSTQHNTPSNDDWSSALLKYGNHLPECRGRCSCGWSELASAVDEAQAKRRARVARAKR